MPAIRELLRNIFDIRTRLRLAKMEANLEKRKRILREQEEGIRRGLEDYREGRLRSWEEVKKELGYEPKKKDSSSG